MACLLLLFVIHAATLLPYSQGTPTIHEEVHWQQAVEHVSQSSTLAQVLAEYLAAIETVEAAASMCSKGHREKHLKASGLLETALRQCEDSSGRQREVLSRCVEVDTGSTVSDVRLRINDLKTCVDSVG